MPRKQRDQKIERRSAQGGVVAMTLTAVAMAIRVSAGDAQPLHYVILAGAVVLLVYSAWQVVSLRRTRAASRK